MTTDRGIDRRTFLQAAGAVAAGGVLAAGIAAYVATRPGMAERLVAHRRDGVLPIDSPTGKAWLDLDPFVVTLLMQQITTPQPSELAVPELWVRALHNGKDILLWRDDIHFYQLSDKYTVDAPLYGVNIYSLGDFVLFAGGTLVAIQAAFSLAAPARGRGNTKSRSNTEAGDEVVA